MSSSSLGTFSTNRHRVVLRCGYFFPGARRSDPARSDTFTYSLVAGPSSTDNSKFKISGNQFLTKAILDFETKPLLSVRIQVTDSGRNTFAKIFQITVTNIPTDDEIRE